MTLPVSNYYKFIHKTIICHFCLIPNITFCLLRAALLYSYTRMPNQFSHTWSKEELNFIEKSIGKLTYGQMGRIINRTASSIQSKVRYMPFQQKVKKYSVDSSFFNTWSAEMAYVLGFIAADGNVYKTERTHILQIASDDIDIIEKIQIALKHNGPIHFKQRENGKTSYSLRICDLLLFNSLLNLGITERKSLTITPPFIPKPYIHHYIRGYFDGDGSVSYRKVSYKSRLVVDICTASFYMASFLYEKIKEQMGDLYKGKLYATLAHQKTRYYSIRLGHKASEQLFKYIYKNANNLYLERKYNKFIMRTRYEV